MDQYCKIVHFSCKFRIHKSYPREFDSHWQDHFRSDPQESPGLSCFFKFTYKTSIFAQIAINSPGEFDFRHIFWPNRILITYTIAKHYHLTQQKTSFYFVNLLIKIIRMHTNTLL